MPDQNTADPSTSFDVPVPPDREFLMPAAGSERKQAWPVNPPPPRHALLLLAWITAAAFLTVAWTEIRLGSLYHASLALGTAALSFSGSRQTEERWGGAVLLAVLLVFGVFRAFTAFLLLRPSPIG